MLVAEIYATIQRINRERNITTILLVEQNARIALSIVDHEYIIEGARIVLEGTPDDLRNNADVREFYLGVTAVGGRKSYRDVRLGAA